MRFASMIFALIALWSAQSAAAAEPCRNDPLPAGADAPAVRFMQQLQAGKGTDAVGAVIDASKLWSQRPGAKEKMAGQVDAAFKAYGPVKKFERVCSETSARWLFANIMSRSTAKWRLDGSSTWFRANEDG